MHRHRTRHQCTIGVVEGAEPLNRAWQAIQPRAGACLQPEADIRVASGRCEQLHPISRGAGPGTVRASRSRILRSRAWPWIWNFSRSAPPCCWQQPCGRR